MAGAAFVRHNPAKAANTTQQHTNQPTNNTPTMTDALSLLPVGALFVAIWVAGELFGLVRAPLVGQIVVGLLLGPGLLDLVPHSEAFELVGLVGLLLLVEGGGLHMDLNTLRVVGWRAVGVGLTGTALPVLAGWGLFLLLGFDSTTGYAAIFLIFFFISIFFINFITFEHQFPNKFHNTAQLLCITYFSNN
jgi:predicted Kef-type K+ transport protein